MGRNLITFVAIVLGAECILIQLYNHANLTTISQYVKPRDRRGRDRMIVGFTTTYAISVYHHLRCEFESRSWLGVLDTKLCDKVCQ